MPVEELISELDAFSYDDDEHVYTNSAGIRRASATQAMHAVGLYDFSRVPVDVLERKRRIGKSVHRATAEYDREGWIDETWLADDELPYFRAWQKFRHDFHEIQWKHIEEPMLTTVAGVEVGGTPDREGWLGGMWLTADIKCAVAKHPAWRIQTATYTMMRLGITRCDNVLRMAVQLRPDETYRIDSHADPTDASAAIGCLQLSAWRANAGMQAPR